MAYITREDGEHFVIPSYRDVLAARNKSALKKDILLLSQNYGEYITLQRKGINRYEVAFSPDTGYLLGESIWHYFKRPLEMIYCEAIPNTTEAILVIVKNGSVYLDGSFPLDSIPEELVIFLTQQNNFEIYVYGDVPIVESPAEGKFSFDPGSVKSFTILEQPAFPSLPLIKNYQLQLVEQVLKAHGIGVFPTKQIIALIVFIIAVWYIWSYFRAERVAVPVIAPQVDPYQGYNTALISPAPDQEIATVVNQLQTFFTMPGWYLAAVEYTPGLFTANVKTAGSQVKDLFNWADNNQVKVSIQTDGIYVLTKVNISNRVKPNAIFPLTEVLGSFVDKLGKVYPGNHITLGSIEEKGVYKTVPITINVTSISPGLLKLIGDQTKDLPMVLQKISLTVQNGNLSGTIVIDALGN